MNINNLTEKQVVMLDVLWSLKTEEDVKNWQETLDAEDYLMSITLQKLLLIEITDELTEASDSFIDSDVADLYDDLMSRIMKR